MIDRVNVKCIEHDCLQLLLHSNCDMCNYLFFLRLLSVWVVSLCNMTDDTQGRHKV